ncbi:hypothetical protein RUND412_006167 [Rhizina undulata]
MEQAITQLLEHVLTPDTSLIKQATTSLRRDYLTNPESLPVLLNILRTHQNHQVRQLAAVEARNVVPTFWGTKNNAPSKIPADLKQRLRESLLQSTVAEPNGLVKHSSARVISSIAKIDLIAGEWLDLPGILLQAASSPKPEDREFGVYVLYTLLESLEDAVADKWRDFLQLFSQTINDRESTAVRLNTLLALGKLAEFLNSEEHPDGVQGFREVLPAMVLVLKELIDTEDEEKLNSAFEVFQTLLIVDSALISNHLRDLIQFFSELASAKNIDDDVREKAISFLMSSLRHKKMKIQAMKVGEDLTLRALQIVTELQDVDSNDDMTPARSALSLLDFLSSALPPSQVVVPLLNVLPQYVNNPDPSHRKAAVLALGTCVEGAPDFIATQIGSILPTVLNLLADPDAEVRKASLLTVSQLADDLAEDIGKEHARLIPLLLSMLDSDDIEIWTATCNALDAVLIGLEQSDVEDYLPTLMPKLSAMFERDDLKLKSAAVGGIGSTAMAARESFTPYFQATMNALFPCMSIKDSDDEINLRATVMETFSYIAQAVGLQAFTPYVQPLMQSTEEGLNLDHTRMRESCFIFFSCMAKVYKEEFTPFLPAVTEKLFQSLEQTETDLDGDIEEFANATITSIGAAGTQRVALENDIQAEIADMDEIDEEDDELWDELNCINAVALEKEVVLDVIGDILTHCKEGFLPYLEKTVEVLAEKAQHPYEGVRKSSIATLWRAFAALWQVSEEKGMAKWQPGLPLKVEPTAELVKLGHIVVNCTMANWKNETDRQVSRVLIFSGDFIVFCYVFNDEYTSSSVTEICSNVSDTLKLCGPAFLADSSGNIVVEVVTQVVLILKKSHPCQLDDEEDDGLELQESAEYDWLVVETAMDVVNGLAQALGTQFAEMWKMIGSHILKYASSTESAERSTSVGIIAECIKYMEGGVTPYTSQLLKLLLHRLSDEDPETKSNAAYGMGLLCLHSADHQQVTNAYPAILQKLEPLLRDQSHRMLDNACGCVSRMIMAHPNNVPLGDVLSAMAGVLPLKEDYEENEPVYKMLVQLYKNSNQVAFGLTQQFVPIFASVLSPPEEQLNPETRAQMTELIQFLYGNQPSVLQGYDNLIALATR